MGQQQLLLVILVTIIVGIATVVAINTFGSAANSANVDAVRQDVASIAASAQGFYMKPNALGGGGQAFKNVTFRDLSFGGHILDGTPTKAVNSNGTYVLDGSSGTKLVITAYPSSDSKYNGKSGTGDAGNTYTAASAGATMKYDVTKDNMTQSQQYTPSTDDN